MSGNRSRVVGAVLASVIVGSSFGAANPDDALAKRGGAAITKKKDGKRGDARRSFWTAKAAGRKVG